MGTRHSSCLKHTYPLYFFSFQQRIEHFIKLCQKTRNCSYIKQSVSKYYPTTHFLPFFLNSLNSFVIFPSLLLALKKINILPILSTKTDFVFEASSFPNSLATSTSEFCNIFTFISSLFFTAFAILSITSSSMPSFPILTTGSISCAIFFRKALYKEILLPLCASRRQANDGGKATACCITAPLAVKADNHAHRRRRFRSAATTERPSATALRWP